MTPTNMNIIGINVTIRKAKSLLKIATLFFFNPLSLVNVIWVTPGRFLDCNHLFENILYFLDSLNLVLLSREPFSVPSVSGRVL